MWTGGVEYTGNLVVATNEFCLRNELPFKLTLLVGHEGCPESISEYLAQHEHLQQVAIPAPVVKKKTLSKRLKRLFRKPPSPFNQLLRKLGITFLFPYNPTADLLAFESIRTASWIGAGERAPTSNANGSLPKWRISALF